MVRYRVTAGCNECCPVRGEVACSQVMTGLAARIALQHAQERGVPLTVEPETDTGEPLWGGTQTLAPCEINQLEGCPHSGTVERLADELQYIAATLPEE